MKKILLFLFASLILFSCGKQTEKTTMETIKIIPSDIEKGLSFSSFTSDAKFLPLELKDTTLALGAIDKILFDDNKIFIFDRMFFKGVMVFDTTGKYLFSKKQGGGAEGEFSMISDFSLDKANKQLKIMATPNILSFSYEGKFLKQEKTDYIAINMEWHKNLVVFVSQTHKILIADTFLKELSKYYPEDKVHRTNFIQPFQSIDEGILFRYSLCDTVFLAKDKTLTPHLLVDFGDKKLTEAEIQDLIKNKGKKLPLEKMTRLRFYLENNTHIYFAFHYQDSLVVVFYDKKTKNKKVFNVKNMNNDITHEPTPPYIVGVQGDYFVTQINEESVFFKTENFTSPSTKRMVKSLEKRDKTKVQNPLLAFIKIKSL